MRINYVGNSSLLIINQHGKIKQLFVPIRVKCVITIGNIYENSMLYVEQVEAHQQHRIIYRVFDKWYPYYFFTICMDTPIK